MNSVGNLKHIVSILPLLFSIGLRSTVGAQSIATLQDPSGLWQTIDDKTGKPKGEVRIFSRGGRFFGQITRIFDTKDAASRCDTCTDERRDQKVEGMIILRDMTLVKGNYQGGDILDPDNGRIYKCRFRLTDGGQHMVVRGFLGLSMFGRSQTWERVK